KVLAKIALNDVMFAKPDPGMAVAWAETLSVHKLDLADMLAAVPMIFSDTTRTRDRILPADVIVKAREIRRERAEREDHQARARREAMIDAKAEGRPIP